MHENPIWPKGRIESICPLGNIIDAWTSCTAQGTYRYAWKSSYGVKVLPWVCNLGHAHQMWLHIAHFHCTLYIFIAHCKFSLHIVHFSLHIAHITHSLKRWLVFGHFSPVTTVRNMKRFRERTPKMVLRRNTRRNVFLSLCWFALCSFTWSTLTAEWLLSDSRCCLVKPIVIGTLSKFFIFVCWRFIIHHYEFCCRLWIENPFERGIK